MSLMYNVHVEKNKCIIFTNNYTFNSFKLRISAGSDKAGGPVRGHTPCVGPARAYLRILCSSARTLLNFPTGSHVHTIHAAAYLRLLKTTVWASSTRTSRVIRRLVCSSSPVSKHSCIDVMRITCREPRVTNRCVARDIRVQISGFFNIIFIFYFFVCTRSFSLNNNWYPAVMTTSNKYAQGLFFCNNGEIRSYSAVLELAEL